MSAQTEKVLARTFSPLGVRVSSLYGSMGVSDVDEDAPRSSEIVVATPEKLDFALRSDPSVLDDVGLVVLDEGHMIGASEREVRYEAQIQRLLRCPDASTRRIFCLSAVFPAGRDRGRRLRRMDHRRQARRAPPRGLPPDAATLRPCRVARRARTTHHHLMARPAVHPPLPRCEAADRPADENVPADQRELVIATAWRLVEEFPPCCRPTLT